MGDSFHLVYLSLGTNLGNREENMRRALRQLSLCVGPLERVSSFIETEPWGFQSSHRFLNACCSLRTGLSPMALLEATQRIERELGRKEKSINGVYHDRLIDIDILYYDNLRLTTPRLTIPHPHMHEREFVMKPLRQILRQQKP
ncbi:MAG: 2-amino-4-hydroxy-6-hydroxymethyldihydropteridine diphosphokinase [Prevotella sp.]|nr:2-amino-4-hydroxy-6-hydroxymethyldihydropteridine diphosphokinase [Bacteroidales bacterium]MDY4956445.1 2-amino-4-hydroxy-6-hydroxymethyldihydropteridine diphosphokinase [Prevotella sp.]